MKISILASLVIAIFSAADLIGETHIFAKQVGQSIVKARQTEEKEGQLRLVLNKYSNQLSKLGKKDGNGTYVVNEADVESIKKEIGPIIGLEPSTLGIGINPKTGNAFSGDTLTIHTQDKDEKNTSILISKNGRMKAANYPWLQAVFTNQKGTQELLTLAYDDENIVFVGTERAHGTIRVFSDGGSIRNFPNDRLPTLNGREIRITRSRGDNDTLRMDGQTPDVILGWRLSGGRWSGARR